MKDKIFNKKKMKISDFKFDAKVVSAFDDMISRSVPFYNESQDTAVRLAKEYYKKNTKVIDIGCSTGTTLIKLFKKLPIDQRKKILMVGYDSSNPMIKEAKRKTKKKFFSKKFKFINEKVQNLKIEKNVSVCFMNYTLQFIRPIDRQNVVSKIYKSLNKGGAFIFMEKILSRESDINRVFIDVYHKYKTEMGYTDIEIKKKREALENVLIPFRDEENLALLKNSGFKKMDKFFKWFNWSGIIAVK
jgi:tRNA (cmo5U34)-methyltransferase